MNTSACKGQVGGLGDEPSIRQSLGFSIPGRPLTVNFYEEPVGLPLSIRTLKSKGFNGTNPCFGGFDPF